MPGVPGGPPAVDIVEVRICSREALRSINNTACCTEHGVLYYYHHPYTHGIAECAVLYLYAWSSTGCDDLAFVFVFASGRQSCVLFC